MVGESRVLARRVPRARVLIALACVVVLVGVVVVLPPPAQAAPVVVTLRPNGPGERLGWTPKGCRTNWNCVSEATADGDATYLLSKAFGDWDSFTLEDLRFAGTVNSVTVFAVARVVAGTGTCTENCVTLGVRVDNSATWWNQNNPPFSTSYTTISVTWATNPVVGGVPWTVADVNALVVSVEHYADNSLRVATARVTQVYVQVSITPAAGVVILRPTANGKREMWSMSKGKGSNFDRIDEVVADGDATYVWGPTPDIDEYVMEDLPYSGTIAYVRIHAVAKLTAGTCYNGCLGLGVTEEYPGWASYWKGACVLGPNYAEVTETWSLNPFGQPWTVADVNAFDIAMIHAISNSGTYDVSSTLRVTQVWAEVYLTP